MPRFSRKRRNGRGSYLKKQVGKNRAKIKLLAQAIEYKYHDVIAGADGMDATGASICLNTPRVGTTSVTRVGDKVVARRLTIRGAILNVNGTPADCIGRIMILRARDQNNIAQTIAMVNQIGTSDMYSHINNQNKQRFQILADKTYSLDTTSHSMIPFYFTHKCKSETIYSADTGAATDIKEGAYYIMYWSSATAGANAPTILFDSRYYYIDM